MASQNDGRIPGGPTTDLIRQQREEARFKHRAVDDCSLRDFRDHIVGTDVPALEQACDNPDPEVLKTAVRNFVAWVKAYPDPPNPPLHIPSDYHIRMIGQRQPLPRRVRHHVTQQYASDSPPQQADEIPPQQAGEGTSQWAGGGTSQWAGHGISDWAGQGTSQGAGHGTSEWAGVAAPAPTQHEDTQDGGGDAPPENTIQRRA